MGDPALLGNVSRDVNRHPYLVVENGAVPELAWYSRAIGAYKHESVAVSKAIYTWHQWDEFWRDGNHTFEWVVVDRRTGELRAKFGGPAKTRATEAPE